MRSAYKQFFAARTRTELYIKEIIINIPTHGKQQPFTDSMTEFIRKQVLEGLPDQISEENNLQAKINFK